MILLLWVTGAVLTTELVTWTERRWHAIGREGYDATQLFVLHVVVSLGILTMWWLMLAVYVGTLVRAMIITYRKG